MQRVEPGILAISTPEGVTFSLTLATPMTRFLAWLVDLGAILAVGTMSSLVLALLGLVNPDMAQALMVLSWFAIQFGYTVGFEWLWRGQTPGKRLLRLRVMDAGGLRLGFSQILLRNLLRFVDMLPAAYLVGGLAAWLSRRSQRLGDLAANTVVVRQPRLRQPDWQSVEAGKYNSLLQHPELAARLRHRAPPEAALLALQSLLRREQLDPQARLELFADMARYFRSLVDWPPAVIEGLSDEQFVRNVADILFGSGNRGAVQQDGQAGTDGAVTRSRMRR